LLVHLLADPAALVVHLPQLLVEVINLLLLNPLDSGDLLKIAGLQPAQARQLAF
jgi:hypothetical protein